MNLYLHPEALQLEVEYRHQQRLQEYRTAAASQRRLQQQLGAALNRLGQYFVLWGQQIQAGSALSEEQELYHGYPTA